MKKSALFKAKDFFAQLIITLGCMKQCTKINNANYSWMENKNTHFYQVGKENIFLIRMGINM